MKAIGLHHGALILPRNYQLFKQFLEVGIDDVSVHNDYGLINPLLLNYFVQKLTCSKLSVSCASFYCLLRANCFKLTAFLPDGSTFLGMS